MDIWMVILAGLLVAVGYLAIRGVMSPLRPLIIPLSAWRLALNVWWSNRRILLAMGLLVVVGASLQFYFATTSGHDERTLVIASIFWQALMAAFVAALAVPLHLFVIHVYYLRGSIGRWKTLDRWRPVRTRWAPVADPSEGGRKIGSLMLRAASYGLAIWIFGYLVGVATRAVIFFSAPSLRRTEHFGLLFISFLITSLLVLVRPALSLGMPRPLRTGVAMGCQRALALYVMMAVLAIPPAAIGPLALLSPVAYLGPGLPGRLVSLTLVSILNIFQYLAIEIATVLFARLALQQSLNEAGETGGVSSTDLSIPASK